MTAAGERSTTAAFFAGAVLAGGNGVAIRFSNRELDPLWGAGLRFSAAALLLLGLMAALRLSVPRGRELAGSVLFGLLQFAGAFALAYYALVELHAGFGQILLGLVPLLTLLLAASQRQERLRGPALAGTLLALVGIAVMSQAPLRESIPVWALLAALGSALCFAQSAVVVRGFPPVHPVTMNAVGMSAGAVALLVLSVIVGDDLSPPEQDDTWLALVYLVVVGSIAVFLLYLYVLGRWTASRAAYGFVVIPIVTVALSAWLDDEPVGPGLAIGGLLVLGGVYIGALRAPTATARRR